MASINKVIIIGNVGKDPEVRYTPNGAAICNLGLATTRTWKDKNSGEKMEETEWHRVVFFDRLAEIVGEYVYKGDPLYVEGRLKTRDWTDKENVKRYTTEIMVDNLQLLGSRRQQEGGGGQQGGAAPAGRGNARGNGGGAGAAPAGRQQSQAPRGRTGAAQSTGTGFDDMDDDIPF